jgi:hypothetical protein
MVIAIGTTTALIGRPLPHEPGLNGLVPTIVLVYVIPSFDALCGKVDMGTPAQAICDAANAHPKAIASEVTFGAALVSFAVISLIRFI